MVTTSHDACYRYHKLATVTLPIKETIALSNLKTPKSESSHSSLIVRRVNRRCTHSYNKRGGQYGKTLLRIARYIGTDRAYTHRLQYIFVSPDAETSPTQAARSTQSFHVHNSSRSPLVPTGPSTMLSRVVLGLGAALASFAAPSYAECTRESLLAAAESYLAAQTSGSIDALNLSTTNFTYQQNNKKADIKTGILTQALKIDLNRTTADPVECASYTLLISSTGSKPYVISTQIRHTDTDAATATITSIDSIIATTGDLFFNAAQTLSYIQKENWGPLPDASGPEPRANRTELKRVGDAYLDMWTDARAADSIPWGTDCERVEGSALTRPCGASLPRGGSATNNGNRRYVIDEEVGSVEVLCSFDALGSLPDSHEIRVEGGKVKYVHTVTVMH